MGHDPKSVLRKVDWNQQSAALQAFGGGRPPAHRRHGARGLANHLLRYASQEQAPDASVAVRAHHDQIHVVLDDVIENAARRGRVGDGPLPNAWGRHRPRPRF